MRRSEVAASHTLRTAVAEVMLDAQLAASNITSKPTARYWQECYLDEGVPGLRRDKTRPSRVPPLPRATRLKVITKTVREAPPKAIHGSRSLMAEAMGISPSSVGRISAEAG